MVQVQGVFFFITEKKNNLQPIKALSLFAKASGWRQVTIEPIYRRKRIATRKKDILFQFQKGVIWLQTMFLLTCHL